MEVTALQVCDSLTRRLAATTSGGAPRGARKSTAQASPEAELAVLVADNEKLVVDLIGRWLTAAGRPWIGVTTLGDAAMALAQHPVGWVVLDWVWPDGSAYMAASLCTQQRIPCCIYTGLEPDKISIQGLRVDVIQKPGVQELRHWLGLKP